MWPLMMSHDASQVCFYSSDGKSKNSFFPFSGVLDEFKTFIHNVSQASIKVFAFLMHADCCILYNTFFYKENEFRHFHGLQFPTSSSDCLTLLFRMVMVANEWVILAKQRLHGFLLHKPVLSRMLHSLLQLFGQLDLPACLDKKNFGLADNSIQLS